MRGEYVLHREADVIVNIVDASHLERHLFLTTQLFEMDAPFILALNMMDVLLLKKFILIWKIYLNFLAAQLLSWKQ